MEKTGYAMCLIIVAIAIAGIHAQDQLCKKYAILNYQGKHKIYKEAGHDLVHLNIGDLTNKLTAMHEVAIATKNNIEQSYANITRAIAYSDDKLVNLDLIRDRKIKIITANRVNAAVVCHKAGGYFPSVRTVEHLDLLTKIMDHFELKLQFLNARVEDNAILSGENGRVIAVREQITNTLKGNLAFDKIKRTAVALSSDTEEINSICILSDSIQTLSPNHKNYVVSLMNKLEMAITRFEKWRRSFLGMLNLLASNNNYNHETTSKLKVVGNFLLNKLITRLSHTAEPMNWLKLDKNDMQEWTVIIRNIWQFVKRYALTQNKIRLMVNKGDQKFRTSFKPIYKNDNLLTGHLQMSSMNNPQELMIYQINPLLIAGIGLIADKYLAIVPNVTSFSYPTDIPLGRCESDYIRGDVCHFKFPHGADYTCAKSILNSENKEKLTTSCKIIEYEGSPFVTRNTCDEPNYNIISANTETTLDLKCGAQDKPVNIEKGNTKLDSNCRIMHDNKLIYPGITQSLNNLPRWPEDKGTEHKSLKAKDWFAIIIGSILLVMIGLALLAFICWLIILTCGNSKCVRKEKKASNDHVNKVVVLHAGADESQWRALIGPNVDAIRPANDSDMEAQNTGNDNVRSASGGRPRARANR